MRPLKSRLLILSFCLLFLGAQGCSTLFPSLKNSKTVSAARKKIKKKVKKRRRRKKKIHRRGRLNWPVSGVLTSSYGKRNGKRHEGIDIAAPSGTKIRAVARGEVIFSGWGPTGYGKMIIIKHSAKYVSVYAHNSKNLVKKGKRVRKGAVIAYVGETGRATGPHLHFEIRVNLKPRNPLHYLKPRKKGGRKARK